MAHIINCPACRLQLQVPEELVGQPVKCPTCSAMFTTVAPEEVPRVRPVENRRTRSRPEPSEPAYADEEYDEPAPQRRRTRRRGFECPFCHTQSLPYIRSEVSAAGWVVLVILLLFCFPLFWIGLLIKEDYRVCSHCNMRLG